MEPRDVRVDFETDEGASVLSAIVSTVAAMYKTPPFLFERASGKPIRWRVTSLGFTGAELRRSRWRTLTVVAPSGN